MLYDIGDRVQVKDDLQVGQRYRPMPFLAKMDSYSGRSVTIVDKDILANAYLIAEDNKSSYWTDDMFYSEGGH